MPSIEFRSASKIYSRQSREFVWQFLLEALGRRKSAPHRAVNDLTLRIGGGEAVGILGHNGAGKTTLLNLVAGLTVPEEGTVEVRGRVCAMMELGSGFHPDLTGRENVRINAALLGLTRREMEQSFDRIVEFSELGEFIEEPIRTYSQGMILRLGFSVMVLARPEILLIDELLAVGDQSFQAKCLGFLTTMRDEGKILICVSHNPNELRKICSRAILLDHGVMQADGPIDDVVEEYSRRARRGE